jgi:hypothetical protein
MNLEKLSYPIGRYVPNKNPDQKLLEQWIKVIETFPTKVEQLLIGASIEKLNWKYRPDGWMVKQVIHHCADSHMNSIMRFKLTLTEDTPTIRPYFEDRWANLPDSKTDDVKDSLSLLKGLHSRWAWLLNSLSQEQLNLEFVHPEQGKKLNLVETIGTYAWHCEHHLAHIENGLRSEGKYN